MLKYLEMSYNYALWNCHLWERLNIKTPSLLLLSFCIFPSMHRGLGRMILINEFRRRGDNTYIEWVGKRVFGPGFKKGKKTGTRNAMSQQQYIISYMFLYARKYGSGRCDRDREIAPEWLGTFSGEERKKYFRWRVRLSRLLFTCCFSCTWQTT